MGAAVLESEKDYSGAQCGAGTFEEKVETLDWTCGAENRMT